MEKYCGLDVHKESIQACVIDEDGNVALEQRFANNDIGLNRLLTQITGSRCVMESSTSCFPVYDFLKDNNVDVRVAHPKRLKAISAAKIKTDKIDAKTLAQLEKANMIPESYIPSKKVREQRGLARHHVQLVKQKTRINNQLKAVLLRHNVRFPKNLFTKKAAQVMETESMPEDVKLLVLHRRKEYALFDEELKEVDARIESLAKENKDAKLLKTMPGVGWYSAFVIATQIDGIGRFPDADHLISYAAICPTTRQSGEKTYHGGIGHDGCGLLRHTLIQDAWAAVRCCNRFKKSYRKLSKKKCKQKAIVAVAKKMMTIMYFMLRNQTAFDPKAGGS
jgi:transposase